MVVIFYDLHLEKGNQSIIQIGRPYLFREGGVKVPDTFVEGFALGCLGRVAGNEKENTIMRSHERCFNKRMTITSGVGWVIWKGSLVERD